MKLRAWLFAPALLALSRLLPASGFGLGVRLGAATLVFLIPGAFLSRALGVRGFAGALVWTMAILFGATAVMPHRSPRGGRAAARSGLSG